MSTEIYYQQKIAACDKDIRDIQGKLNAMALTRLVLFLLIVYAVYALVQQYSVPLLIVTLGLVAAFIICVNIYYGWKDQRRLIEKLRFVNVNELGLLAGKASQFPDGAAFLDSEGYLDDLDVFGPQSLFHVLNRTTTIKGQNFLVASLRQPLLDPAAIRQEQEAVQTLAPQTEYRQLIMAHGLLNEEKDTDLVANSFRLWLDTPSTLYRKPAKLAALAALILFNCIGIYIWISSDNYSLLLVGFLISRLVLLLSAKYIHRQHDLIDRKKPLLDQYAGILATFNSLDPGNSSLLLELRNRTGIAHNAIRRLSKISNYFDHGHNGLVNIFLNSFFLYDWHCVIALERWRETYRTNAIDWLEAVGPVERLNSLATFAYNHPDTIYPEPVAPSAASSTAGAPPTLFIETTGIAHPLIPAGRRIANDCTIGREEKLILITGSNMSGKTTFLRTLGVNLLMAQCGLPVCAASFRFTPMHLLTSLRIDDSLLEQTSYFMAELKKLQRIVYHLQTGAPSLVLIDEILRGTNSEDKTHGSEQFIRRLLGFPCLSLFATHDLTLGALEHQLPGAISNYCFESVIEDGELHFNYQLQRGIASNRNASFLMKKMDII